MKHIIIFSILFCLVFLNVPRSLVHDCENHHELVHHDISDNENQSHDLSLDVDVDACFICQFDLGAFSLSEFKTPAFSKFCNYTFNEPSVDYVNPEEFFAFSHRGPPIA